MRSFIDFKPRPGTARNPQQGIHDQFCDVQALRDRLRVDLGKRGDLFDVLTHVEDGGLIADVTWRLAYDGIVNDPRASVGMVKLRLEAISRVLESELKGPLFADQESF